MAECSELDSCPIKGQIVGNATYNGKSWQIRIKIMLEDGKIKYTVKKGFSNPEDANQSKEEFDRAFERDARRQGLATTMAMNMSVQDYLKYYLEEILGSYCAPSTEMVYRYTLYKHILPNWDKNIQLELLREDELNQLLETLEKESVTTASKAREFMYLAFKHACNKEKRISRIPRMKKCPRSEASVNVLNKNEIKELLAAASKTNWYLEILLALFVGLRKSEILGLKFSDFDEVSQSVSISRQLAVSAVYEEGSYKKLSSERIEKAPKTHNSVRIIHVPDYVWQELDKRRASVEKDKERLGSGYCDAGYVSCTEDGHPRGVSSLNTTLTKLCARNGIKHMTVHGLRHCYASILLEQKYELPVISALLGHSSINTTYEFYADIIEANSEIITCLNELYAVDDEESEVMDDIGIGKIC